MKNDFQKIYLKKAKIAAIIIQTTPYIRMVGLNGSLARGQASTKSDIDFVIIAKTGRIWTCRAASMLIMAIFGLKRYANKTAGRVCLNLYHTEDHTALTPRNENWAYNHAYTTPLWQSSNEFERFMKANAWIKKYDHNFYNQDYRPSQIERVISIFMLIIRRFLEILFDLILADWGEKVLSQYQIKRIENDPRTKNSSKGLIFISNYELRFHPPKFKGKC